MGSTSRDPKAEPEPGPRSPHNAGLPIILRRELGESEVRLRGGLGTKPAHRASRLLDRPAVSARGDHLVHARGAQPGMLLERLADEREVGVERAGAVLALRTETLGLKCPAHGVGMQPESRRDGADAPVLREEQSPNLRPLRFRDHAELRSDGSARRWRWMPPRFRSTAWKESDKATDASAHAAAKPVPGCRGPSSIPTLLGMSRLIGISCASLRSLVEISDLQGDPDSWKTSPCPVTAQSEPSEPMSACVK